MAWAPTAEAIWEAVCAVAWAWATVEAKWVAVKCAVAWAWVTVVVKCAEAKDKSLAEVVALHLGVHLVHGNNNNLKDPKEVKAVGAVRGVTKVNVLKLFLT